MNVGTLTRAGVTAALLVLAGCATGPGGPVYVPAGGDRPEAPEPPRANEGQSKPPVWRKSEMPDASKPAEQDSRSTVPSYQESGDRLSPAALSLVQQADAMLRQNNAAGAIARLERAQRIAPRSSEIYFKLSEAYVVSDQLGRAEQFALKGLSIAGNNARLQRAGWLLLADIRRARGNVAGASQAEERARAL
jgi:tetratricopeptide (TPR) repeat protein